MSTEITPVQNTDTPLIHTALGNVPVDSLVYETAWDITSTYIKFVEKYTDKSSGEIVRENAHVFSLLSVTGEAIPNKF
jgi:hypothetical protein